MEEKSKITRHREECNFLNNLYQIKNHDYGDSFGKSYKEYGMIVPCIRLEDKLNRLKSLTKRNAEIKVTNENLRDTLEDIANYAIMTIIELDIENEKS